MELRPGSPRHSGYSLFANSCAQCGETLLMPEWSEYVGEHRVRHLWQCEACGYKFETLVRFREPTEPSD